MLDSHKNGGKHIMEIVNWNLMKHPINWIVILLMLIIAGLFGHYLLTMFDQQATLSSAKLVTPNLSAEQTSPDQRENKLDYLKED